MDNPIVLQVLVVALAVSELLALIPNSKLKSSGLLNGVINILKVLTTKKK